MHLRCLWGLWWVVFTKEIEQKKFPEGQKNVKDRDNIWVKLNYVSLLYNQSWQV